MTRAASTAAFGGTDKTQNEKTPIEKLSIDKPPMDKSRDPVASSQRGAAAAAQLLVMRMTAPSDRGCAT